MNRLEGAKRIVVKVGSTLVTDGGRAKDIVANAPETEDDYFLVPKVVE